MKSEDVTLTMLDEPLPLFLVMQVFYFGFVLLLSFGPGNDLPVTILYDFLIFKGVVVLLRHHVIGAVTFRGS